MGKECAWKGKHFLLCCACSLSLLPALAGCIHPVNQWQGRQALREAESLMERGAYEASLNESLQVLNAHSPTLGDEALFQMGLLYAHPENPWADRDKAVASFERIQRDFPLSRKKEEARLWSLTLRNKDDEVGELQKKVNGLKQAAQAKQNQLELIQLEIHERDAKFREAQKELEAKEKKLMEAQKELDQLNSRVTQLEAQLLKFKDVDLTIEKKKRANVP